VTLIALGYDNTALGLATEDSGQSVGIAFIGLRVDMEQHRYS